MPRLIDGDLPNFQLLVLVANGMIFYPVRESTVSAAKEFVNQEIPIEMIKSKHRSKFLFLLVVLSCLGGCSKETGEEVEEAYDAVSSDMKDTAEKTRESFVSAWGKVADYSVEQKDAFVENFENAYAGLRDQSRDLSSKTGPATNKAKEAFKEAGNKLQAALDKAGEAGKEGWEGAKTSVKLAWNELTQAYEDLETDR